MAVTKVDTTHSVVGVSNEEKRTLEATQSITADRTMTSADSGELYFLNSASGCTVTLPSLKAGINFKFIVATASTGTDNYVITSPDAGIVQGIAIAGGTSTAAIDETNVNFIGGSNKVGDYIIFHCDGTNWYVEGATRLGGGLTFTT